MAALSQALAPGSRAERLRPILAAAFAEAQDAMKGSGLRLEVEVSWIELRLPIAFPPLNSGLYRGRIGLAVRRWLRTLGVRVVVRVRQGEDGAPEVQAEGVPTGLVSWWIKPLRQWLQALGDGARRATWAWLSARLPNLHGRAPS